MHLKKWQVVVLVASLLVGALFLFTTGTIEESYDLGEVKYEYAEVNGQRERVGMTAALLVGDELTFYQQERGIKQTRIHEVYINDETADTYNGKLVIRKHRKWVFFTRTDVYYPDTGSPDDPVIAFTSR